MNSDTEVPQMALKGEFHEKLSSDFSCSEDFQNLPKKSILVIQPTLLRETLDVCLRSLRSKKAHLVNYRMKRDLSKQQFEYRATKLGFKKGGFMGYWSLASNPNMSVSVWNAGERNRDRLRYLMACDRRERAKLEAVKLP